MLLGLNLKNFALVESAEIDFDNNLNILTGETGAGKSILIDAVGLALGGRGSTTYIRSGSDKCKITATFKVDKINLIKDTLELYGIEYDDNILIVDRELSRNGRNKNLLNGVPITLNMLKSIGNYLINISGQHEHTKLLQDSYQLEIVDLWGGAEIEVLKKQISDILKNINKQKNLLKEYGQDESLVARELDILNYQLEEIHNAHLVKDEDEELENESRLLRNIEKISGIMSDVENIFYQESSRLPIVDQIGNSVNQLDTIKDIDSSINNIYNSLSSIYYSLQDLNGDLLSYINELDFDANRLDTVEERLNEINNLKKKYGNSISEILIYANKLEDKIYKLQNSNEERQRLNRLISDLRDKYIIVARKLSELRNKAGNELCSRIQLGISELGMEHARLSCLVEFNEKTYSYDGSDTITMLFSANKGEPQKPIQDVISGGELSRVMLVIKALITNENEVSAIIFDEIDVGIGGKVAKSVADKLSELSKTMQVLCVTHLPVIAAAGNHHFKIEKGVKIDRTVTSISRLTRDERVVEIMRMMGSDHNDPITRDHALKLLNFKN